MPKLFDGRALTKEDRDGEEEGGVFCGWEWGWVRGEDAIAEVEEGRW